MKKLYRLIPLFLLINMLLPAGVLAGTFALSVNYQDTIPFSPNFRIPPKPELQTSVYDYGKVLNETEKKSLEEKLLNYADSTSTQIVVVTIPSLLGASIEEVTPRWAQEWGIGQADKDNGVLILLSDLDNEIWISPGYGVDDRLTAGQLGHMVRTVMIPEFKVGQDYKALDKGTNAIFQMLEGKYTADKEVDEFDIAAFLIFEALIFFICLIYHAVGGFWAIATAVAIYSAAGKSSGKSRSGFRGGFGGGGFSGGGAGGKW